MKFLIRNSYVFCYGLRWVLDQHSSSREDTQNPQCERKACNNGLPHDSALPDFAALASSTIDPLCWTVFAT